MDVVERVEQHIKALFGKFLNQSKAQQQIELALQESVPVLTYPAIGAYLPSPRTSIRAIKKPEPVMLSSTVNETIQEELEALNDLYPVPVTRFFEKDEQFGPNFRANLPKPYGTVSRIRPKTAAPSVPVNQVLTEPLPTEEPMMVESVNQTKPQPAKTKPTEPERESLIMFQETNRIFAKSINQLVQGYFQ